MKHSTRPGRWAVTAALAVSLLSACAHQHPRQVPTSEPESPPPAAPAETTAPSPEPSETSSPPAADENAPQGNTAAAPTCVCQEAKSKPKVKTKPRVAHKQAPPQLPTAPVVSETPAGGVVDAQVRPMPVSVMSILGKRVEGPKGDNLGRVVDVLADASGRVRIAIIDFGGFLGVGDRRIAVDWPLLRFNPDSGDSSLLLSVERDKLKTAPEYKDNPRPQTLMEPELPAAPSSSAPAPAPAPATAPTPTTAQPAAEPKK